MAANGFLRTAAFALGCSVISAGYGAEGMGDPGLPREFSAATLAKVSPGETTKKEVEKLLGTPWRTTFADDADEPGPVVWEYRGQGSKGTYRVHIEFDSHDIATLIAKIPDDRAEAPARVAKTPAAKAATPEK